MGETSVLVVEYDADERRRIGALLDGAGFDVLQCPGPAEPDYVCLGGRGKQCPLAKACDVVVLDVRLGSDAVMRGTPGWQLLVYYMEAGKRIVALSDAGDFVHPLTDDTVTVIERRAGDDAILAAVREFVRSPNRPMEDEHGDDLAG